MSNHRRQVLLIQLSSQSERQRRTELAKKNLLAGIDALPKFTSNSNEKAIVAKIEESVVAYLQNYESLKRSGVRAGKLYQSVSESSYRAQETIQELMRFNLDEASRLQIETNQQNRINYLLVLLSFLLLLTAFSGLFYGFRKYFYLPTIKLKQRIENFELGANAEIQPTEGVAEIQSIWVSVKKFIAKLEKQKDIQLNFLSSIAHDLKNPLNAIKISIDLISEDPSVSEQSKEMIAIVGRQISHLTRLIGDLLDTSRIESGHMDLRFEISDIRRLIEDSTGLYESLSQKHKLKVETPASPVYVICDEHRLTQVLNNLLSNAIKYSPSGGLISVKVTTVDDSVNIQVSDEGLGIAHEDLEGIFEPFRRSSSTRDSIPGIGLGLSVSRKIIRGHTGGEITVSSNRKNGTIFTIRLQRHAKFDALEKDKSNSMGHSTFSEKGLA